MSQDQRARKMLPPPATWDDLFPNRFLKATMLRDKKVTLTIKRIEKELLPNNSGDEEPRSFLLFVETPLHMAINRTNSQLLQAIFGLDIEACYGKQVTIFQTQVKSFGKMEPAIRIWGSPELTADMQATVKLVKRQPNGSMSKQTIDFTLHKTERRQPKEGGRDAGAAGQQQQ